MHDTPRPARAGWLWRLGVLLVAVALTATAGTAAARSVVPGEQLSISESGCGAPMAQLPAGSVTFNVTDHAVAFATVYVVSPAGLVYAEINSLTPGKTLLLSTTLAAGTYAIRCVFSDNTVRTSSLIVVTGTTTGAVAGYLPLPDLDMQGPVTEYSAWVSSQLPHLLADSTTLDNDIASGNLTAAKADWLTAHLDYERLGVAYNSFGDFDDEINGMAKGLPDGTATPGWTGFFAIEYALWHGESAARIRPLTKNLVSTINGLIQDFPSEEIDPGDLPLRSHEILENGLQFQLTGIADYGSGTTLATLYANTQGTQEVLRVLTPLIQPRDPGLLAAINQDMTTVQADLDSARTPGGTWTPLGQLSTVQRQQLDGDLGTLLEDLSVIPNLLAPRTFA